MATFRVRYYVATNWSLLSQADHYEEMEFETSESLSAFAVRLAKTGFEAKPGKRWIMPGAILEVTKL